MAAVISVLILVHRWGSEQNSLIAKQYRGVLNSTLTKGFSEYDGELVVEAPNIIKLYISGRETCLFGILAFAVYLFIFSLYPGSK